MTQGIESTRLAQSDAPPGGLVLMGLPDDGKVRVRRGAGLDGVSFVYPGTANFLSEVPEDIQRWPRLLLPVPQDAKLEVPKLPVVNHMGDADRYKLALGQAVMLVEKLGTPCFNHPAALLRTTRDGIAARLAGIPGVLVPLTVRISPNSIEDFPQAVEEYGLRYPVIARLVGTQTGRTQILIESAGEWARFHGISWREREVYLTQYVECRDLDGFYRKQRLGFVGGRAFPISLQTGRMWSVHSAIRPPEGVSSEEIWLEAFEATMLPQLEERLTEIFKRVGLEFFGMDFSLRPDGNIVVFEVNASMSMLSLDRVARNPYLGPVRHRVREELFALLRTPARWNSCLL